MRVLILGGGFGGIYAALYLSKLPRLEKKVRVALDWTLDLCFAKDLACVGLGSVGTSQARPQTAPLRAAAGGA